MRWHCTTWVATSPSGIEWSGSVTGLRLRTHKQIRFPLKTWERMSQVTGASFQCSFAQHNEEAPWVHSQRESPGEAKHHTGSYWQCRNAPMYMLKLLCLVLLWGNNWLLWLILKYSRHFQAPKPQFFFYISWTLPIPKSESKVSMYMSECVYMFGYIRNTLGQSQHDK